MHWPVPWIDRAEPETYMIDTLISGGCIDGLGRVGAGDRA